MLPDREKWAWGCQNDHVVVELEQGFHRLGGTHGYRQNEAGGLVRAEDSFRRLGRAPRCEAVVHHDDDSTLERRLVSVADPAPAPGLDLLRRRRHEPLERIRRDSDSVHQRAVDVDDSPASHGPDSQFGLTGRSDLANHHYLERRSEAFRDLIRDLDTAARQPDHHGFLLNEVTEFVGQSDSRRPSIRPSDVGHGWKQTA